MTLCLIYKTKSSDTIWYAIKNKLSTCSLCWDPSDICTKMRMNRLNQSECSFTPFVVWMTDSSAWTVSESECASVYCIQCRQDSGSDCNFYFAFVMTRHSHKCQPLSNWTPMGGPMVKRRLFVDVLLWRQCSCKQLCLDDITLALQIQTSRFSEGYYINAFLLMRNF